MALSDPKPFDHNTPEEVLAAAMLLGFEWDDNSLAWFPCSEACDECCNILACWGMHCYLTIDDAAWRFLFDRGLVSTIRRPTPNHPDCDTAT